MPTRKVDLFARRDHFIDHLAPVWHALPEERRGVFYTNEQSRQYAHDKIGSRVVAITNIPNGQNPVLTCAYGDMNRASRSDRKLIMMEHGTGHGFKTPAYPDALGGQRDKVSLFLSPNEYTAKKTRAVRSAPVHVIGTPKIDFLLNISRENPGNGTVCISFHWGNKKTNPPESGSALEYYLDYLPLYKKFYGARLVGHGHPLARDEHKRIFEKFGIEYLETFDEVCRRVSLYVSDISSTLYEFTAIGKPVILLNAPWFRKDVHHGIRFWDYSDIGRNVDHPAELIGAIESVLANPSINMERRKKMIRDLYPFLGVSAEIAANRITDFMDSL